MNAFPSPAKILANQGGTALVLVLVMLAVLMILVTFALNNSTVEVKIAGNYRASNESLFAAERGVQVAMENLADGLNLNTLANNIRIDRSGLDLNAANGAAIISIGPPPLGSGMDATTASGFQAQYYAVEVRGVFPEDAPNPSRSELEMQVSRIVAR